MHVYLICIPAVAITPTVRVCMYVYTQRTWHTFAVRVCYGAKRKHDSHDDDARGSPPEGPDSDLAGGGWRSVIAARSYACICMHGRTRTYERIQGASSVTVADG